LRKHVLVTAAIAVAALSVVLAPTLAGAETAPTTPAATGVTDTIAMKIEKGALKFVGPKTVTQGDELEIVNETDPKKVGPHTFSLVTEGSVPKTKSALQKCQICGAVAKWQGAHEDKPPTINPAKAGAAGWDTEGSLTKKGDSWFTQKKGESFEQEVSAPAGTTIHYICAIHPFMHGTFKVLPAS
jgi:hypothetical protein